MDKAVTTDLTDSPSTSGLSASPQSSSASSPIGEVIANLSGCAIALTMIVVFGPRIFDGAVDVWVRRGLCAIIGLLVLPPRTSAAVLMTVSNVFKRGDK